VTQPRTTAGDGTMLVANLQTGAWSRFTGLDARTFALFDGFIYYGSIDGFVYRMQEAGDDDGMPYTCTWLGQHDRMGSMGEKTLAQMRPMFTSNIPILPQVTALPNYDETVPSAPNAFVYGGSEGWDVSVWDTSLWDAAAAPVTTAADSQWVAIGRTGHALAPVVQVTMGGTVKPEITLIGVDAMFRPGAEVA